MLQVVISSGEIRVVDVPPPALRPGAVLVRTRCSLVSAGTESAMIGGGGGRENLLLKAIRNPALVRKVLDRVSTHGLRSTAELVRDRLSRDLPLGYSCAGTVAAVGTEVDRFRVGDRVACAGAGYANHASSNVVPQNLVAALPEGVSLEEGAFATLGAIALQGVRRGAPALGDRVAVMGLGLLGQMTCQLLRASGAVVIGSDVRPDRVERAGALGVGSVFAAADRDFASGVLERTEGRGADIVIVTAAAPDPGLLNRACEACRRKGRVVLVGDVPIRISRDRLYTKEIDFLISTSYGPGRYDPEFEEKGRDYPFAYVRWTETRNLEEVLRLISVRSLDVRSLVDARFPISDAPAAYQRLAGEPRPIGVLLEYPTEEVETTVARPVTVSTPTAVRAPQATYGLGVIGFGSYFRTALLPLLRKHPGFRPVSVCARTGLTVKSALEKDGFARGTTDYRELLSDPEVDVVYVATRHDLHYSVAKDAVAAGKAVFVEKPMTLSADEGRQLMDLVAERKGLLTVGFNRRFSPHAVRLKQLLAPLGRPLTMAYRVNAGPLPENHWLLDPIEGGGRLLGEGVHFFDFLSFLVAAEPLRVRCAAPPGQARNLAIVSLEYADGSVGTLIYSGNGAAAAGKERLEVFAGGATMLLDDFRRLDVHGLRQKGSRTRAVEKGQAEQLENFYRALRGEAALGVTAKDGWRATWCAEQALMAARET